MSKNLLDDKSGYIKYALMNCNPDNSSRQANYAYKKLTDYYKAFEKDVPAAEAFLRPFIEKPDENYSVMGWACAHAFGLGILTDVAVEQLNAFLEEDKKGNLKTTEALFNSVSSGILLKRINNGEKILFY